MGFINPTGNTGRWEGYGYAQVRPDCGEDGASTSVRAPSRIGATRPHGKSPATKRSTKGDTGGDDNSDDTVVHTTLNTTSTHLMGFVNVYLAYCYRGWGA